jgi:hypothetical protein
MECAYATTLNYCTCTDENRREEEENGKICFDSDNLLRPSNNKTKVPFVSFHFEELKSY